MSRLSNTLAESSVAIEIVRIWKYDIKPTMAPGYQDCSEISKVKVKVLPITGHEGPEGE